MIGICIRFLCLLNFGLRRLVSNQVDFITVSLHIPFSIIPSFLLALFWHESLKSMKVTAFLSTKTATFFGAMCIITFLLELTSDIGRAFVLEFILIDYILYPIEDIGLSIFFFYNCYKVYKFLTGKESHLKRKTRLQRMTFRIFLSAIGLIIFEVGWVMNIIASLFLSSAPLVYISVLIFNNGLNITSVFHALAFSPHAKQFSSKTNTSGTKSSTKNK